MLKRADYGGFLYPDASSWLNGTVQSNHRKERRFSGKTGS
jgi:hypothetical protein